MALIVGLGLFGCSDDSADGEDETTNPTETILNNAIGMIAEEHRDAMRAGALQAIATRDLLDVEALAQVEAELQRLVPERHARDAEGVAVVNRR